MANEKNLKPLTTSRAREIGSLGGKKAGERKRQRKTFRLALEELLSMELTKEQREKLEGVAKGLSESITVEEAIVLAQVRRAVDGNLDAAQFVRDTVGEKPMEKVSVEQDRPFAVEIKVVE